MYTPSCVLTSPLLALNPSISLFIASSVSETLAYALLRTYVRIHMYILSCVLTRFTHAGSYIVNTARGKICDRNAIADALKSGQLAGYAGDVWFPQPAPKVVTRS